MATKADTESRTVLKKLGVFCFAFYLAYYLASIVLVGAFNVGWNHLGSFPFRIAKSDFNPSHLADGALGAWLAMVATYSLSIGTAYYVVATTKRTWDYMMTISLLHWAIACAVNAQFPTNWIWWVTMLLCTLMTSMCSEILIYRLRELQEIPLHN